MSMTPLNYVEIKAAFEKKVGGLTWGICGRDGIWKINFVDKQEWRDIENPDFLFENEEALLKFIYPEKYVQTNG